MKVRLPKGVGGGPSDMNAMIRQAQNMQEELQEKQAELEEREYEVKAGGGAVAVKIRIPANVTARIVLPQAAERTVGSGEYSFSIEGA
ncbi:MAG: YbaB/EbfC family nucleoid-associated protein, partial [Clostridia bacterium]|nr:YbaB/EbfC family nucleoid-associated protein [Clostridia bacterium]